MEKNDRITRTQKRGKKTKVQEQTTKKDFYLAKSKSKL